MFNFLRGGAFILVIILFNIISLQAQSLSSLYEGPTTWEEDGKIKTVKIKTIFHLDPNKNELTAKYEYKYEGDTTKNDLEIKEVNANQLVLKDQYGEGKNDYLTGILTTQDNWNSFTGNYGYQDAKIISGIWKGKITKGENVIKIYLVKLGLTDESEKTKDVATKSTWSESGVLFGRMVEDNLKWYKNGDERKDIKFVGEIENEKPNGQGTLTTPDGENSFQYVGKFKDGLLSGQGTMTFTNGIKYVGQWKDNLKNGQGTLFYPNGGEYVGEFKDGFPDSVGTENLPEGRVYVGKWKDGQRHGQGTSTNKNGVSYNGEWKDGKRNGQGTLTKTGLGKYVGSFKDGKYHGQGTFTHSSGEKYVGEWKEGKQHGQGTLTKTDGDKYVGEWKEGKQHGQGILTKLDGFKYIGEFKENLANGQGTLTLTNGLKYFGGFRNGLPNGQGTLDLPDGRKYIGEFKDDKFNGQGTLTLTNGEIIEGLWKDGKPWNLTKFDKNRKIILRVVNGKLEKSVVNNKQFLLNKWWGLGEDECNLKLGEAMIFLWDNEGNEFWIIDKKSAEETYKLKINPKQLINSKWLVFAYGKPDIGENYVKGVYYDLDNKEKLEYYNMGYKFQNRKNENVMVMNTLEHIKTDESGKKIKQDVVDYGKFDLYDCEINNIRGTKEFSSQFKSIKSKWNKSQ